VDDSLHIGTPPQGEEEVGPVREALRLLDQLLDVRWNATAFVEKYGAFDSLGHPSQPQYAGRWQVIRFNTDRLHLERDFAVIMTVTLIDPPNSTRKYPIMNDRGAYMPLDWRIVEYVQLCDRANCAVADERMKELWNEHDQAEAIQHDRSANQEALEKVYGKYWTGGAQGAAHPETVRRLWGTPAINP
jgi:hypothetical protein